jgi:hypothetical protein
MGEKETAEATGATGRSRTGNTVSFDDRAGTERGWDPKKKEEIAGEAGADKSVQWEPHKAPGLDTSDDPGDGAALKTRHDTVKNSIGNIR